MPVLGALNGSYNNYVFDKTFDDLQHKIYVTQMDGVDDLPTVRQSDVPRAQQDGSFGGLDYLDERVITLGLNLIAPDNPTFRQMRQDLETAFQPMRSAELPLYLFNNTRIIFARVKKRSGGMDLSWAQTQGETLLELVATDPRKYAANLTTLAASVAVLGGGVTFPLTFPLTFGTATVSGQIIATNAGNYSTLPTAHITGPVDNPRIEHTDQGAAITMAISLAAGDYLDIDFAAHTIILNGTASRRSTLTAASRWFELTPGDNHLRYSADTVQLGSVCTLTFRSAWL
jgi:hypothetical protein